MSKLRAFTEQSRDEIIKAITNQSTSKQAWSFSKTKRFAMPTPNCPYVCYNTNQSTISNRKTGFGSSRRRVFTQVNEGPSPWVYQPSDVHRTTTISFAGGRNVSILVNLGNSSWQLHISIANKSTRSLNKNPGPGRYEYMNAPTTTRLSYTMRPRTANHRNCNHHDIQISLKIRKRLVYQDQVHTTTRLHR